LTAGRRFDDETLTIDAVERFRAKWIPVRVKKTRSNKELESLGVSVNDERLEVA
jgi:hypothetical protein